MWPQPQAPRALEAPYSTLQGQVWLLSLSGCHVPPPHPGLEQRSRVSQVPDAHGADMQQVHRAGENVLRLPRPRGTEAEGAGAALVKPLPIQTLWGSPLQAVTVGRVHSSLSL